MNEIDNVPLDSVRINGGTQSRVELNQATIAEYAESIRLGVDLPPVVVFFDGANFWLADGFHRYHAHREAGAMEIAAEVRTGAQRDAKLFSFGANDAHGLRRTPDDKRKAVMGMLADDEWKTWSQARIAKECRVSVGFVSKLVNEASIHGEQIKPAVRTVERGGKTYKMDTANIGKMEPGSMPQVESDSTPRASQASTIATTTPAAAPSSVATPRLAAVEIDDDQPDLAAELVAADKEIRRLSQLLDTFTAGADLAKEVADWSLKFDQLSGRNAQLVRTSNEAQGQARYANDLLTKIRKVLGVTANAEIIPALTARRTA